MVSTGLDDNILRADCDCVVLKMQSNVSDTTNVVRVDFGARAKVTKLAA